jgi:hypothetical protein
MDLPVPSIPSKGLGNMSHEQGVMPNSPVDRAFICKLPTEVLVEIFQIVQCTAHADVLATPEWSTYDRTWPRIMCVCRHFRDVALQSPTLWSTLDLAQSGRWLELCDQRSGAAPLHLRTHEKSRWPRTMPWGLVDSWVSRAETMALADYGVCARVLHAPAPLLRALDVRTGSGIIFEVDTTLLGGTATSLAHLTVHGPNIILDRLPPLPALRCLELCRVILDYRQLQTLIDVFVCTPQVEDLSIKGVYLTEDDEPALHSSAPLLPRLRILEIADTAYVAAELVRLLPAPRLSAEIQICAGGDELRFDEHLAAIMRQQWIARACGEITLCGGTTIHLRAEQGDLNLVSCYAHDAP